MSGDRDDDHLFRIEVTVAATLVQPNGYIIGGNMIESTLAFGWRVQGAPPPSLDAAVLDDGLAKLTAAVMELLQPVLTAHGWRAMGSVDEPMVRYSVLKGEVDVPKMKYDA